MEWNYDQRNLTFKKVQNFKVESQKRFKMMSGILYYVWGAASNETQITVIKLPEIVKIWCQKLKNQKMHHATVLFT